MLLVAYFEVYLELCGLSLTYHLVQGLAKAMARCLLSYKVVMPIFSLASIIPLEPISS